MDSLPVIVALGLAAYRVTQLVVHDTLLDPLRLKLEMWHARKIESRVRSFVRDLTRCVYCLGWHASWLTVLVYQLATGRSPLDDWSSFWLFGIESFAVAGVQALLNRIDDTLPVRN